jgi:hypothetical protein
MPPEPGTNTSSARFSTIDSSALLEHDLLFRYEFFKMVRCRLNPH